MANVSERDILPDSSSLCSTSESDDVSLPAVARTPHEVGTNMEPGTSSCESTCLDLLGLTSEEEFESEDEDSVAEIDQPLYPGSPVSLLQTVVMILKFVLR